MYYLTVARNGEDIVRREPYGDYAAAIDACSKHYSPRSRGAVLTFVTEVVNGRFTRTYAELNRPEDIDPTDLHGKARYSVAAKSSNAFEYSASYLFLVESDAGIESTGEEDEED